MLLVTGGAGFIGSHVVLEALRVGYEVVVLDDLSNGSEEALRRVEDITKKRLTFVEGTVNDGSILAKIFGDNRIACVIHLAGLKSVAASALRTPDYYRVNVEGTLSLCEQMISAEVRNMIFSSSATVYGDPLHLPIAEHHRVGDTQNPYGTTKFLAERMLADLCLYKNDLSITSLRYFNPIGAHESGAIGESSLGPPENLLPYIAQVASGQRSALRVFGNDYDTLDGTGVRDYIHVMDLAEGHIKALDHMASGYHVYNLGTGHGTSVLELVRAFERVSDVKIPLEFVDRRMGDVAACYADSAKAQKVLGWRATRPLEQMVRDAWRWQNNNPQGYCK